MAGLWPRSSFLNNAIFSIKILSSLKKIFFENFLSEKSFMCWFEKKKLKVLMEKLFNQTEIEAQLHCFVSREVTVIIIVNG